MRAWGILVFAVALGACNCWAAITSPWRGWSLILRGGQLVIVAICFFVAAAAGYAGYVVTWGACAVAPAEVQFQQGMTLCPGQSAHFTMRNAQ